MSDCLWPSGNQIMQDYHDNEWCIPSYDDRYIFEMLILEGAQAGLSWNIVLSKRDAYKQAFYNFDIVSCSKLTDEELDNIKITYNIIKNTNKIKSVRTNANLVIDIQKEYGSFSKYLWMFSDEKQIVNNLKPGEHMQVKSDLSEKISKDLMKRGFKFVGPVIIYSFMQAIGMIDDHIVTCSYFLRNK